MMILWWTEAKWPDRKATSDSLVVSSLRNIKNSPPPPQRTLVFKLFPILLLGGVPILVWWFYRCCWWCGICWICFGFITHSRGCIVLLDKYTNKLYYTKSCESENDETKQQPTKQPVFPTTWTELLAGLFLQARIHTRGPRPSCFRYLSPRAGGRKGERLAGRQKASRRRRRRIKAN